MKNLLLMGLVLSSTMAFGADSIKHATCNVAQVNVPGLTTSHASVLEMIEKKGYVLSKDKRAVLLNESAYTFSEDPTYKNTDAEVGDLKVKISAYQQEGHQTQHSQMQHSSSENQVTYYLSEAYQRSKNLISSAIDSVQGAYNGILIRKSAQVTGGSVNKVTYYNSLGKINNETDHLKHVEQVINASLPSCEIIK